MTDPENHALSKASRRAWRMALGWLLLVYVSVPLARPICTYATEQFGRLGLLVILSLGLALPAIALGRKLYLIRASRFRWLVYGVCLVVLAGLAWLRRGRPEELIHLAEYGVLAGLVLQAFGVRIRDLSVFAATLAFCFLAGTVDEIIQWITPGRYWDLADVRLNGVASLLALALIGLVIQPPWIRRGFSLPGARVSLRWTAAWIGLTGLCLLNTPDRARFYTRLLPEPWYRELQARPMAEYGYLYDLFDVGRFKSRLTGDALLEIDRTRADEFGAILVREGDDAQYADFLVRYSPSRDPFLHELRVHLFRRDRYVRVSREREPGSSSYATLTHHAWREELFLQRYFQETVARAGRQLEAVESVRLRAADDPARFYRSPVSSHLITEVNEIVVLMLALVGVGACFGGEMYLVRREAAWTEPAETETA